MTELTRAWARADRPGPSFCGDCGARGHAKNWRGPDGGGANSLWLCQDCVNYRAKEQALDAKEQALIHEKMASVGTERVTAQQAQYDDGGLLHSRTRALEIVQKALTADLADYARRISDLEQNLKLAMSITADLGVNAGERFPKLEARIAAVETELRGVVETLRFRESGFPATVCATGEPELLRHDLAVCAASTVPRITALESRVSKLEQALKATVEAIAYLVKPAAAAAKKET